MKGKINYLNYDMYSKRTSFFFKNQEKIGSYFGIFLTLTYLFTSIILFINQIILAIQKKELRVYDTTIYAQEMPSITVDSNQLYFAFGLEDPLTSNRFIDDSIYVPKIVFIDKIKKNDKFVTVEQKNLEYERCNVENFGKDYQHLFIKDELNSSYCLKDFNFNLTFAGGYKYERMTYIRIRIYPCVNNTENNNTCKSQDEIDHYMSSGYFSILLKDFGLNPSNYSFPVLPTLQDLYTTIDKKLYRNYILNFGVTEIHTDSGLLNENTNIKKYLQFRKELQTFTFRDEQDYYNGKSVILVQLKLDDTIVIQRRSYTKLSDMFSRIGGYMQLLNTVFILLSSIINKLNCEIKILNSIFKFNLEKNKIILKFKTLKESNLNNINLKGNKNSLFFSPKRSNDNSKQIEIDNKSKNNLIFKENELGKGTLSLNISEIKKYESQNYTIKINKNKNNMPFAYSNLNLDSIKSKNQNIKENSINFNNNDILKKKYNFIFQDNINDFNGHIYLDFFDIFCSNRQSKKYKLFNSGNSFYKKKIDIVHVFTIISIIEKIILNHNSKTILSLYEEIE